MSKGKKKSNSSYTNTQTLNPWSQNQWQGQWDRIQGMMNDSPVQAYSGPLTAGLSDRETQARGMYAGQMGSFNGAFDQAATDINGAGLQADFGAVADQYMNPYQTQVIDALRTQSGAALDESLAQQRDRALANRAYGGSGYDVAAGIATGEAQRNLDSQVANLLYTGYNDARGYYGSDIDRRENRALTLADLAAQQHGLNMQDIAGLDALGAVDRGVTQAGYDANYAEWLRQQDEATRRLGIQVGLLGTIPMLTNSSGSSSSVETSNPGALGMLGQGLGIASMFAGGGPFAGLFSGLGGAAATAGSHSGSGLLGTLGARGGNIAPSDPRLKEDIELLGERGGVNWYRYRYGWDKPGTAHEGVMADELETVMPEAVVTTLGGLKMVNYAMIGG